MTEAKQPDNKRPEYMQYVTDNVIDFFTNRNNLVACVSCCEIYTTKSLPEGHGCLWCSKCGIDAVMVVAMSPLCGLSKPEQKVLLEKWHVEGFTPIPRSK